MKCRESHRADIEARKKRSTCTCWLSITLPPTHLLPSSLPPSSLTYFLPPSLPPASLTHSPQEVGLLGLAEAADAHVRQQLLLQDVLGILDPMLPGHSRLRPTHTDEVEGHILLLNHKRFIERRLQLYMGRDMQTVKIAFKKLS